MRVEDGPPKKPLPANARRGASTFRKYGRREILPTVQLPYSVSHSEEPLLAL
jgi:hypothetical protein